MSRFDNIPPQNADLPVVRPLLRPFVGQTTPTGPDAVQDQIYADFTGWSAANGTQLQAVSWEPAQQRYFDETIWVRENLDFSTVKGPFRLRVATLSGVTLNVPATSYDTVWTTDPLFLAFGVPLSTASVRINDQRVTRITQNSFHGRVNWSYPSGTYRMGVGTGVFNWTGAGFVQSPALATYNSQTIDTGFGGNYLLSLFGGVSSSGKALFLHGGYATLPDNSQASATSITDHLTFESDANGYAANVVRGTLNTAQRPTRIVKLDADYAVLADPAGLMTKAQMSPVGLPGAYTWSSTGSTGLYALGVPFKFKTYGQVLGGSVAYEVMDWSSATRTVEISAAGGDNNEILYVRLNDTQGLAIREQTGGTGTIQAAVITYAGAAKPTYGAWQTIGTVPSMTWDRGRSIAFTMPNNRVFVWIAGGNTGSPPPQLNLQATNWNCVLKGAL